MAKKTPSGELSHAPTFSFIFTKHPDGQWTSQYLRGAEVRFEIDVPNTYQFNAAVMEAKMRLAIHE